MDKLNEVWQLILPWIPTIVSVVTAIGAVCFAIYKVVVLVKELKNDNKKNNEELKKEMLNSFKEVIFKHDIAPLVESNLKALDEKALSDVKNYVNQSTMQYNEILTILGEFSAFFDDSISISNEKKKALKTLILNAQSKIEKEPQPVESQIIIEEPVKKKEKKNIER